MSEVRKVREVKVKAYNYPHCPECGDLMTSNLSTRMTTVLEVPYHCWNCAANYFDAKFKPLFKVNFDGLEYKARKVIIETADGREIVIEPKI